MHATGLKKRIKLFTETEESEIVAAIVEAENRTSAEIRVHISHSPQAVSIPLNKQVATMALGTLAIKQ